QQEAAFISTDIGASLANYDSVTQYSFSAKLGGIFYLKDLEGDTNESLSNSTLSANLSHSFDQTLRYNGSVSFAWQPEPNYANGIANSRRDGDYIYVYVSSSVSKAWTSRYSTTVGANYSMIDYQEDSAKTDNRDYVGMEFTNRYKWTERLAVSLGWNGSYCDREYGNNEFSNFVMAGAEYAVAENTSATLRVGPQFKYVESYGTKTYPSAEFGLNHRLSDRFMIGMFVRYSNEATNTYVPNNGSSYYSNETWRVGVNSTLKVTHRVSLNCGVNLISSDYTNSSSSNNSDTTTLTFNATAGVKMMLTNALALTAQYSYTNGSYSGYNYPMPSYNRNVFSFGMNYSF
ncbi:outer membrane beta-barrel protein, partial [uncultured Akkermansia sp.]|uniref:outer membrane beta-barrel protein n=1 Tax=uncultured Akkermansia sp. TaxID=512294 RepID=UPI00265C92DE